MKNYKYNQVINFSRELMEKVKFEYKYGFSVEHKPLIMMEPGLSEEKVVELSKIKKEPKWMREFRVKAFKIFLEKPLPNWGPDLSSINFDEIHYFVKPTEKPVKSWEDLPEEIRRTYELIGIPEAERNFLAGVSAQFESEVVYENVKKELERMGVIFCDMDTALKKYPDIVKEYFGKLVPPNDNKFAALNSAVWSGGSFIYVPKGVKVPYPLQAYFRINAQRMGQFERTLIIVEEGSFVHYVEGCSAPIYSTDSLHAAVVEIFVKRNARARYTTIQNWSMNVYNLVTKRSVAEENAFMEWVDCNIGSKVTMKYPSIILKGKGARGEVLSLSYASENQHQDTGAKVFHLAPNTSSRIISKSVSREGGRTSYRGLVQVVPGAKKSNVYVSCDALILDSKSRSDTYPYMKIQESDTNVQHEATVEKIDEEKIFYLTSRGIKRQEAESLLVNGFIEPITKELPLEYAIELNRLINLEMIGTVG